MGKMTGSRSREETTTTTETTKEAEEVEGAEETEAASGEAETTKVERRENTRTVKRESIRMARRESSRTVRERKEEFGLTRMAKTERTGVEEEEAAEAVADSTRTARKESST